MKKSDVITNVPLGACELETITQLSEVVQGKTWEDNPNWDDCVVLSEQNLFKKHNLLNPEVKCEHLKVAGNFFAYCSKDLDATPGEKPEGPFDSVYQRKIGTAELQLHCGGSSEGVENYKSCCFFKGELQR